METTRRTFIRNAGRASAAMVLTTSIAPQFANASFSSFKTQTAESGNRLLLTPEKRDILTLAIKAPSGHNTQPWLIEPESQQVWNIHLNQNALLPVVDPSNREALLSIGAFLENLSVASAHYGYHIDYKVTTDTRQPGKVLRIHFDSSKPSDVDLSRIKLRRTLRNDYLNKTIRMEDVNFIAHGIEGFSFYPQGSAASKKLDKLVYLANAQQVNCDAAMKELGKWIRWSDKAAEKHQNGLTPESMEMSGVVKWLAKHFFSEKDVMKNSFRKQTLKGAEKQIEKHGGWVILTSPDNEVSSLIETGRRFERMLLRIRERGIAMHPMSQVLEESPYNQQVNQTLDLEKPVQFVIRTGYVDDYPYPVSLRKEVGDVVVR
ncbi:MAG: hypothetical protein K9J27_02340 [Bacteroidales bacterium]|nr:hypothetical protein [Bacteroidales bacterium]MCF8333793.1 hypothetical protein [Bacteroidales bacterium]